LDERGLLMVRKLLVIVSTLIIPTGLILVTGEVAASAYGPPKATGIANCHISSGTGTLTPGLTPVGTQGKLKISFTASLIQGPCPNANVTSPPGVTIVGGTVTGSGVYKAPAGGNASACADFDGPDILGHLKVTVAWQTTGGNIAKTNINYKGNPGTVSGSPTDTITLDTPPAATAVKTGSFASPSTTHTVQLDTNIPGPLCGSGPYSTFVITGGVVTV
jgi:hypothetical protein